MKILIVSDIHGMSKELRSLPSGHGYAGIGGSFFDVENRNKTKNPVLGIGQALRSEVDDIELLLCLGDIAHQAKKLPLLTVWRDLHDLAEELVIPSVISVIGNHDLPSRATSSSDAEGIVEYLPSLNPKFPSNNDSFNTEYFAYGVAATEIDGILVIAINTCRIHGYGFGAEPSKEIFERGSLSTDMIERCENLIEETMCTHTLIAMHHHPLSISENDEQEKVIENGHSFLDKMASLDSNILIVHGHTHTVKVTPFNELANGPIIFSSASLCALPITSESTDFSNQFHIVDYDTSILSRTIGTIYSWEYGSKGWERSPRSHMPYEVRFGETINIDVLSEQILDIRGERVISGERLKELVPSVKYLDAAQTIALNILLEPKGIQVVVSAGRLQGLVFEEGRE